MENERAAAVVRVRARRWQPFRDGRWPAVLCSLGLSAWTVFQDPVVNNDGVKYLETAELVRAGDWAEGLSRPSPLYSVLIGVTGAIFRIDVEPAAHALNALFFSALVLAFISLVKEAGGDRRVSAVSALVILLYATVNEYRSYITRDAAYVACYLLSLWCFLRHWRLGSWGSALGFGLFMLLAACFRVEGVVFLVLLPFALLCRSRRSLSRRAGDFLRANAVFFTALAAFLLATWLQGAPDAGGSSDQASLLERLKRPYYLGWYYYNAFGALPQKASALEHAVLPVEASGEALSILIAAIVYILCAAVVKALTPLHAGLTLYAAAKRPVFPAPGLAGLWLFLLCLNLLVLLPFVVKNLFLTGRYPLAFALTSLLAVPFGLVKLHAAWKERRARDGRLLGARNWVFPLVVILLAWDSVDGLVPFAESKTHIKEAGIWIRENTRETATLGTNSVILGHYAQRTAVALASEWSPAALKRLAGSEELKASDYVAIRLKRDEGDRAPLLSEILGVPPVKTFASRRRDQVLIFEIRRH